MTQISPYTVVSTTPGQVKAAVDDYLHHHQLGVMGSDKWIVKRDDGRRGLGTQLVDTSQLIKLIEQRSTQNPS